MPAKTPLHVTPSSHALSTYLYRCIASSFPEEPHAIWQVGFNQPRSAPSFAELSDLDWHEMPIAAPEHKQGETKD